MIPIIKHDNKSYIVLESVDISKFKTQENVNKYFANKITLKEHNTNIAHVVREIPEAVFEDIPQEPQPDKEIEMIDYTQEIQL